MVWLGVITGFQDFRISGFQDFRISGFQDFRTLAQSLSGRSLLRGAAVCSQDIFQ
jgi:hypothetical protein